MKSRVIDYGSAVSRNRETFLVNYRDLLLRFEELLSMFEGAWRPLATRWDAEGHSHAGLLPLITLAERHLLVGFSHFASYQSYLGWLTFRPALEAVLFVGVWADDPSRAEVWRNWENDRRAYMNLFSNRSLRGSSFPDSERLGSVLSRLNDQFAHPNPRFVDLGLTVEGQEEHVELASQFFDPGPRHLANALAFVSLLEFMAVCSAEFLKDGIVISGAPDPPERAIPHDYAEMASELVESDASSRETLDELGLWAWSEI